MIKIKKFNDDVHGFCRTFYKELSINFDKDFLKSLWTHNSMGQW